MHSRQRQSGLTLTELLVVVAIVVITAGVLVPMLQPVLEGQSVREASRQLSAFVMGAQARAVDRRRPVGVWFEQDPNIPNAAWQCFLAEQPIPYTGDTESATVESMVVYDQLVRFADDPPQDWPGPSDVTTWPVWKSLDARRYSVIWITVRSAQAGSAIRLLSHLLPPQVNRDIPSDDFPNFRGDRIRVNQRGDAYPLIAMYPGAQRYFDDSNSNVLDSENVIHFVALWDTTRAVPPVPQTGSTQPQAPGKVTNNLRFQILRRPRKTMASQLTFPEGTSVDMLWSGFGSEPFGPLNGPSVIMFDPLGGVDSVYVGGAPRPLQGSESLHLLLGEFDQVATNGNLSNDNSIWMSINMRTGRTTSSQNVPQYNLNDPLTATEQARAVALQEVHMGG